VFNFQLTSSFKPLSTAYLILTFPTTDFLDLTPTCTSLYGLGSSLSCNKVSSTQLRVNSLFPKQDDFFTLLQISNMRLPGAVNDYVIAVQVYESTGTTLIGQGIGQSFKVTTESGTLGMLLESRTSIRVGEYCNLEVKLAP